MRPVAAHRGQIALPQPRTGELQDATGSRPPDELRERPIDRSRVRPLAADLQGVLEQLLIKHKICAFHTYKVRIFRACVKQGRYPTMDRLS